MPVIRDPRLRSDAYLTDGRRLYEVISIESGRALLRNSVTDTVFTITVATLMREYKLVEATS